MVCQRCIFSVKSALDRQSIPYHSVVLGEAELCSSPSAEDLKKLENELNGLGFEIIDNRQTLLIEKTKKSIL